MSASSFRSFKELLHRHSSIVVVCAVAVLFYLLFVHGRLYGEINGSFISYGLVMKEQPLPLWSTQLSGGYPLYANPEVPAFSILNFMLLLVPDVVLAFSAAVLVHMLIAGVGAFLFARELVHDKRAAMIAGVAYVCMGSFAYSVFTGTMPYLFPLAFLPFLFLFVYRALHTPNYRIRNALYAAALFALQIFSGGTIHFLWSLLGIGIFLSAYALFALLQGKRHVLSAIILIGVIMLLFTVGFSSVKLLPALEFNKLTNRAQQVSYDEFVWKHTQITLSKFSSSLFGTGVTMARTGIIVFLLAAASLLSWKRRYVLALGAVALVALLIEVGTPLTQFIYHLPGYDKTRQIYNVLGLFSLVIAIAAGIGWSNLLSRVRLSERFKGTVTLLLIALILVELFVVGYHIQKAPFERDFADQVEQNSLLREVAGSPAGGPAGSQDPEASYSRLHLYGEDFVGLSLTKYALPYGIRMFDWTTGNVWFNDYVQFSVIAGQQNSAKLWGIADVRHIASKQPLDIAGLEFAGQFEECTQCDLKASYLYRNTLALPHAYVAPKAVLLLGDPSLGQTQQLLYQLLLDPSFDPSTTAVIVSSQIPDDLDVFGLVLLAQNPSSSQQEQQLLTYAQRGGLLEPNIATGSTQANPSVILGYLLASSSELNVSSASESVDIIAFEPTRVELRVPAARGMLVLSEKFYKFKDWHASGEQQQSLPLMYANGYSTAVFINSEESQTVVFEYQPRLFTVGLLISLLSLGAALFLIILEVRKGRSQHHSEKSSDNGNGPSPSEPAKQASEAGNASHSTHSTEPISTQ